MPANARNGSYRQAHAILLDVRGWTRNVVVGAHVDTQANPRDERECVLDGGSSAVPKAPCEDQRERERTRLIESSTRVICLLNGYCHTAW